ncbi:MAG: mevalonate kinase family protein [Coriobacteriia bacterium]
MKNYSELTVSTPGRVCLFGEHQDYLNLPIIACAISLRVSIEGNKRNDNLININLPDINDKEIFSLDFPIKYDRERDYFKSTLNVLNRNGFTFSNGIDCTVKGKIPINAGTSSSSALIIAWVNFLTQMSDQSRKLSAEEIAYFAYEAEVLEFAEPGGMMDQYSTAVGGIIFLESYPKINVERIDSNLGAFVLGDSQEPKDTKFILARVKNQIQNVSKELQKKYPDFSLQNIDVNEIGRFTKDLNKEQIELLEGTIKNRDITRKAKKLLLKSPIDHKEIGLMLTEHQAILRDVLKISTPKIDRMIDSALKAGAYGAKINGSGGGGCMFAYAPQHTNEVNDAIEKEGGKGYIIQVDKGTHSSVLEAAE